MNKIKSMFKNKKDAKKPILIGGLFIALITIVTVAPFLIKRSLGSIYNIKQADNPNISIETPKKVLLGDPTGWEQFQGSVVYNWDNFIVKINNDGDTTMTDVAITLTGSGEVTGIANGTANFECQDGTNSTFEIPAHESKTTKCYGAILAAQGYQETDQKIRYSYKLNGLSAEAESETIHFYQIVPEINNTNVPQNSTEPKEFEIYNRSNNNENFWIRYNKTQVYMDMSETLDNQDVTMDFKSLYANGNSNYVTRVYSPQHEYSDKTVRDNELLPRVYTYFNYTQLKGETKNSTYFEILPTSDYNVWKNFGYKLKGTPKQTTNGETINLHVPIMGSYWKKGTFGSWSEQRNTYQNDFRCEDNVDCKKTEDDVIIQLTIYDKSELAKEINNAQSKADLYEDEYYDKTDINNAISTAVNVYKTRVLSQSDIDSAKNAIKAYVDSYTIPEIPGDYSELDALRETANAMRNEVPNHTELALYESDSWEAFTQARDAANNLSRNITKQNQSQIDAVKDNLANAMQITSNEQENGLVYHEGYYDSVTSILNTLKDEGLTSDVSDLSGKTLTKRMITYRGIEYNYYSESSWNALQNAVNEIGNADLTANEQDQIEAIATGIADAYAALEVGPAVYDYVTEAINEIYEDTGYKNNYYKPEVRTAIDDFIENTVGYNKNAQVENEYEKYANYKNNEHQDEVDALEESVRAYKAANLIRDNYIDADYTALNNLLVTANAMENKIPNYPNYKLYTDATWNTFVTEKGYANEISNTSGIKIDDQNIIDAAVTRLQTAMQVSNDGLKYRPGYYNSINEILSTLEENNLTNDISDITNITLVKRTITVGNNTYDYYTTNTWNELVNSVDGINDQLLANDQASIEEKANSITSAYNNLEPNDAIYDAVEEVINAYLDSDAYKNGWYTESSKQAYEEYITNTIGYDLVNKVFTNKLKMDNQETVNGYVTELNNIQLVKKDADYSTIKTTINNYLSSNKYSDHWFINEYEQAILEYISNTIKYDMSNDTFTDKLTIDKQNIVDGYNTELINRLSDTTKYKDANYDVVKATINNYLSSNRYTEHWFIEEYEQTIMDYITNTIKYNSSTDDFNEKLKINEQSIVNEYNTTLTNLLNANDKYKLAEEKYNQLSNEINDFVSSTAWQNNWYVDDANKTKINNYINGNYDQTITIDRANEVNDLINDFRDTVVSLNYKKALGYVDSDNYKTNEGYLSINGYKSAFNTLSNSDDYVTIYNDEGRQTIYDYLLIFNNSEHEKMNIKINRQSDMDTFLDGIKAFYDNLDNYKNTADYSQLEEIMNSIDSSLYTPTSWNAYTSSEAYEIAINELANPSYKADEQDGVTTLINNVIAARNVLEYKGADYSEFISTYNNFVNSDDYALYTEEYKNQVKAYYDEKIAESVKINEQNKITEYVRVLNEKIANPRYILADYGDLENEISSFENGEANSNNWYIQNNKYTAVTEFIDSYDKTITINRQSEVTNLINQFKILVNALDLKDANYDAVTAIINNYVASDGYRNNWYDETTKNAFENELNGIYNLSNGTYITKEKIDKQDLVDAKADTLEELFNNLKLKDADYTELRKILAALPNASDSEFEDEITTYVNKVLNNLDHTIDKQNIVDALVNEGRELLNRIGSDENDDQDEQEDVNEIENKTSDKDNSKTNAINNTDKKESNVKAKANANKITNFVKIDSDDKYDSLITYIKVNNTKINIKEHPFTYTVKYATISAKIEVGTVKGASAKVYGGNALVQGNNEITIVVTDSNNEKHYYKLNIIRESTSTYLTDISIGNGNIKFNKKIFEYTVSIKSNVDKLDLSAIAEDKNAKVTILGNKNLKDGSVVRIKVEDTDGNLRVYTLNISKKDTTTRKVLTLLGVISIILVGAKIYAIKIGEMTIYNLLFKKRVK